MFKKSRVAGKRRFCAPKNSQIKGEKQLDSLADALELLTAKLDELEKDCEKKQKNFWTWEKSYIVRVKIGG